MGLQGSMHVLNMNSIHFVPLILNVTTDWPLKTLMTDLI